ncbi:MAG: helix-turn-helix domain-containing protein [Puniceicoccales bacterium]|jgi:excisionase family DNA binding protein|nr:helix-turn-helix domain-containing protein [Puniceicoccales bacterium]
MSVNGNVPSSGGTYSYLTREEAAEYLRVTPAMLRDNHNHIPSYKLGGKVLYTKEDLDGLARP